MGLAVEGYQPPDTSCSTRPEVAHWLLQPRRPHAMCRGREKRRGHSRAALQDRRRAGPVRGVTRRVQGDGGGHQKGGEVKAKLNLKKTRTCYIPIWKCPHCLGLIPSLGEELADECIEGYVSLTWLLERGYKVEDGEA